MSVEKAKVGSIMIDCKSPERLFEFWNDIVGVDIAQSFPRYIFTTELPGNRIRLGFQKVPEHKTVKNRVHIDLTHEDPEAFVAHVIEVGGSKVDDHRVGDFHWTVLADPEGNEFCVTAPHEA